MKSKGDELDVDKLVSASVDLTKLRDVVKNGVVCNAKINDIEVENEVEKKIPNITNLATTSAFTTIENDVRDRSKNITTPEFNKLTAETFTATNGETKI